MYFVQLYVYLFVSFSNRMWYVFVNMSISTSSSGCNSFYIIRFVCMKWFCYNMFVFFKLLQVDEDNIINLTARYFRACIFHYFNPGLIYFRRIYIVSGNHLLFAYIQLSSYIFVFIPAYKRVNKVSYIMHILCVVCILIPQTQVRGSSICFISTVFYLSNTFLVVSTHISTCKTTLISSISRGVLKPSIYTPSTLRLLTTFVSTLGSPIQLLYFRLADSGDRVDDILCRVWFCGSRVGYMWRLHISIA